MNCVPLMDFSSPNSREYYETIWDGKAYLNNELVDRMGGDASSILDMIRTLTLEDFLQDLPYQEDREVWEESAIQMYELNKRLWKSKGEGA